MNRQMSDRYHFARLCHFARVAAVKDFEPDADYDKAIESRIKALEDTHFYRAVATEEDQEIVRRAYVVGYQLGWYDTERISHG